MRAFLLFVCFYSTASFAAGITEESPQKPMVRIQLLDKLYSETTNAELPIGKELYYGSVQINVQKCIRNNNGEAFSMISIRDNGDIFYEGWMPVSEYAAFPIQHARYDITISACSIYETVE
jgi:hypothetical protein